MKEIEQSGRSLAQDVPRNLLPKNIIRSKRRTIALILKDDGGLIVRAPLKCSDKKIEEFILKKSSWILSKKKELKRNNIPPIKLDGRVESIPLLGKTRNIQLYNGKTVKLEEAVLFVPAENGHDKLKKFLIKLTKKHVIPRTQKLAERFGYTYTSISIRDSKSRWGSCGYKNSLNFSFRLAMCPYFVIDYIILHELTHTIVKNHGNHFYKKLSLVLPNYTEAEDWLKVNKSIMNLI